ncbi:MAG: iron export ABC transporter permease subunit FetB [Deltaproteobacteria bacterium]|jgi:putative ABC transport system permease protein|nr:iron export ABC transporter permease subunit FetB [Deltaproteobacteria bacterium]MBW2512658.1 iron export ABC transporter permease subunit FetB [Deltaproteobacteria bacterium]MDH4008439.1 iron export ABC transporter permease subunit FetB [Desulfuromonadales bacterium]HKJ28716.1 iron export ABC transporter permease subunit FetB [Desulfuromonadales bacterium]
MNPTIIDLSLWDLVTVYSLLLMSIGLAHILRAGQGRDIFWSGLRMFVQLMIVGYLLHLVFALESALPVLLILVVMTGFAVQTIGARVETKMPNFYRVVGAAILFGCGGMTFFFCTLVIGLEPWYDPRYLIPLAGMVIGNSMTGASLAAERLAAEFRERREEIETALCLGSSVKLAAEPAVSSAFRAALIPSVNAMAAMGLVFLPGMMTGQILSGTEPLIAVKYQIAIMCVITGSVALTTFMILRFGYRSYFTSYQSLRDH